jgi:solute carrier family 10 (sodium/bile acid cotransporter), member 7
MIIAKLKKNWFFVGVGFVICIAFQAPFVGRFIEENYILKITVFLVFVIIGLELDTKNITEEIKKIKNVPIVLFSSFVMFPVVAYFLAYYAFPSAPGLLVGASILATAPVTPASGTVLTRLAKGNVSLSLFICILTNIVAIFTIPLSLSLMLQSGIRVELPILDMLVKLFILILIPILLGQILKYPFPNIAKKYKKAFSIFTQCIVLLMILTAISSSTDRISAFGVKIIYIAIFILFLHVLIVMLNYYISHFIGYDEASRRALVLHSSQKTLTVSFVVWDNFFSTAYPMALILPITYYIIQNIVGTFIAGYWGKKMEEKLITQVSHPMIRVNEEKILL